MEVLQKIDTRTSHQVVEVPKIFPARVPQRLVESRLPQMAEQLVEVPMRRQIVDIPVPRRPGQNSTARTVEQIVDIPVPSGGLLGLPDPGGSSSSAVSRDERGEGFFRAFPWVKKKSKVSRQYESEGAR